MKGCARVWFCYQKHNEKRGFDCCSLLRVKKHPEDAGPSLAHNIKRLRIPGAHKWAMAQESTKLSAPFLVAQMVFGFSSSSSSSSSSSLLFPLPHTHPPRHPGPQAPSSCARSHSRCANPGVAFLQGPIQVYKSQMLSCSRSQSRCANPDILLVLGPNPGVKIQMLSLCQAPFPQVCKSRCCLVPGPIPTGVQIQVLSCARPHSHWCVQIQVLSCARPHSQRCVQIQVLSCSWSHSRCANLNIHVLNSGVIIGFSGYFFDFLVLKQRADR